jgi:hypothetical protein
MKLTYVEAAVCVLHDAGRPLLTQEVTDAALAAGLIQPQGRTPNATMSAALYRRVKVDARLVKFETPGFVRAKRGSVLWGLSSWSGGAERPA